MYPFDLADAQKDNAHTATPWEAAQAIMLPVPPRGGRRPFLISDLLEATQIDDAHLCDCLGGGAYFGVCICLPGEARHRCVHLHFSWRYREATRLGGSLGGSAGEEMRAHIPSLEAARRMMLNI